jgi:hypothetical protein
MDYYFQYWLFLTLFSVVSLTSLTNMFDGEKSKDWSTEQRWVFSVTAVSLIMSFLACVFYMFFKQQFTSNKLIEIGWTVVVLAFWCAGLPALMDYENQFAMGGSLQSSISNGNLFFASWGALIVSLMLATSHFQVHYNRHDDKHLFHWVGFAASGLAVMCSTSRFWSNFCTDSGTDTEICARTAFGLVLGAVSFVVGGSIAWIHLDLFYAQLVSIVFVIAWCFGVSYLTFDQGPAVPLGSLYFGTWFSLLFALAVAGPGVLTMIHKVTGTTEETTEGGNSESVDAKNGGVATKDGAVGEDAEEEEVHESA